MGLERAGWVRVALVNVDACMFETYEKWPCYLPLRDALQPHWQAIRAEALALLERKGAYVAWPERGIYRGQWDVFGLRWQDTWLPSSALLRAHPPACRRTSRWS